MQTVQVLLGTLVLAVGTACFLIPNNLVTGGVTGIAMSLCRLIPSLPLSVEGVVALLGWGLFLVGWLTLGNRFAVQTLLSTLLYPIALRAISYLPWISTAKGGADLLAASLLGGAAVGAGCALTFLGGGSTGGVDVIALVACKYVPSLRRFVAVFLVDAVTVLLGLFAFGQIWRSILGVLSALTSSLVVRWLMRGE